MLLSSSLMYVHLYIAQAKICLTLDVKPLMVGFLYYGVGDLIL